MPCRAPPCLARPRRARPRQKRPALVVSQSEPPCLATPGRAAPRPALPRHARPRRCLVEAAAPGEKSAQDDIVDADFKEVKDK